MFQQPPNDAREFSDDDVVEPTEAPVADETAPPRPWTETIAIDDANFDIMPWRHGQRKRCNKVTRVVIPASVERALPIYTSPECGAGAAGDEEARQQRRDTDGKRVYLELNKTTALIVEANCNLGKTFQVNAFLIRLLTAEPHTPVLQLSVRICHARDIATEGNEAFDEIWEKVYSAPSASQK